MKSKYSKSQLYGLIAIGIDLIVTLMEVLILCKVFTYDIIMGGQMKDYESAAGAAVVSIIIQTLLMSCLFISSGLVHSKRFQKASIIVVKVFIVYFCVNIIMNLFGKTWFEKIAGSVMCIVQIFCMYHIVKENADKQIAK